LSSLNDIYNYIQLTERVGTSGQPSAEQFADIADAGYRNVINLALPDSDRAIANEGSLVTSHGMRYLHIPVDFENPTVDDARAFIGAMKAFEREKTWVHCAVNARVSAFMYLYLKHVEKLDDASATSPILKKWSADMNAVWSDFLTLGADDINA
jgi:protein tyrosine phosphatase (PTP) superfamily phosphohydrolase (DUF442 family)